MDSNTTIEQIEQAASYLVTCIRTHRRVYGGCYRIWFSESLPGHKMKVSVWYNFNTSGIDLDMMGEARTHLNFALNQGLRAAGVTYTLPPIASARSGMTHDAEMHLRNHLNRTTSKAPMAAAGSTAASGPQGSDAAAASVMLASLG